MCTAVVAHVSDSNNVKTTATSLRSTSNMEWLIFAWNKRSKQKVFNIKLIIRFIRRRLVHTNIVSDTNRLLDILLLGIVCVHVIPFWFRRPTVNCNSCRIQSSPLCVRSFRWFNALSTAMRNPSSSLMTTMMLLAVSFLSNQIYSRRIVCADWMNSLMKQCNICHFALTVSMWCRRRGQQPECEYRKKCAGVACWQFLAKHKRVNVTKTRRVSTTKAIHKHPNTGCNIFVSTARTLKTYGMFVEQHEHVAKHTFTSTHIVLDDRRTYWHSFIIICMHSTHSRHQLTRSLRTYSGCPFRVSVRTKWQIWKSGTARRLMCDRNPAASTAGWCTKLQIQIITCGSRRNEQMNSIRVCWQWESFVRFVDSWRNVVGLAFFLFRCAFTYCLVLLRVRSVPSSVVATLQMDVGFAFTGNFCLSQRKCANTSWYLCRVIHRLQSPAAQCNTLTFKRTRYRFQKVFVSAVETLQVHWFNGIA